MVLLVALKRAHWGDNIVWWLVVYLVSACALRDSMPNSGLYLS